MNKLAKYLEEIVYGGNDGIVTTFAVAAGFSGAQVNDNQMLSLSFATVLLFGLANLFADALSMGLGSFLSVRSGLDVSKSKTAELQQMLTNNPQKLEELTTSELKKRGLSESSLGEQLEVFKQAPNFWLNFLTTAQGLNSPEQVKPVIIGLVTFVSFALFGTVPLLPYLINMPKDIAFAASVGLTFVAMMALAIIRAKVSNSVTWVRTIAENMLVGGLAAAVAFGVGIMFS